MATITDKKVGIELGTTGTVDYFEPDVATANDYYPFGMAMPGRKYTAPSSTYRYGFNGKEKAEEISSGDYDYGARIYDGRLGRWLSVDPLQQKYPFLTPYNFVANTPLSAYDPDGKLIIFIGGLLLWEGNHQNGAGGKINSYDKDRYWKSEKNTFGEYAPTKYDFRDLIGDNNTWFTSGSSQWNSQAKQRSEEGKVKAQTFHAMVQSGEIKLAKDETIKIVAHSQGGAHGAGFAEQLMTYKGADGKQLYNVEVIYYITPHQPTDITNPKGVRGVQYSHPSDAVSSDDPWWLPNGGSKFGKIKGITEFDGREIMGPNSAHPEIKPDGPNGNRGGHNVNDNTFIFDIPAGQPGYVAPRKDTPKPAEKKPGG